MLPVHHRTYTDHRSIVALQHGNVVQRTRTGLQRLVVGLHLNHGVRFQFVVTCVKRVDSSLNGCRIHVGQKTQTAHVDAHDGYAFAADEMGRAQKSAVATHRDDEVCIEVAAVEHLHAFHSQLLSADKKVVEIALHEHFGALGSET